MILAGDIGGTKTLLALYQTAADGLVCVNKQHFASGQFAAFSDLLAAFLGESTTETIERVCLGVAGPIVNGDCHTTNLPWSVSCAAIRAQTGAQQVRLLNDLQATAWGILHLPASDFVELNNNSRAQTGNIAILAAGTGLGEAIIHWDGTQHHVIATEGGHTDFAPVDTQQIELLQFLMAEHPNHVSYERVVCGQGLVAIYRFLLAQAGFSAADDVLLQTTDPAAAISEQALQGSSSLCEQALTLFCQVYGAEAGNLALKTLSYGGVVLAGGIAAKILPFIQKGAFLRSFLAKGRYVELLSGISVKVCLNPEAGLLGAAYYSEP